MTTSGNYLLSTKLKCNQTSKLHSVSSVQTRTEPLRAKKNARTKQASKTHYIKWFGLNHEKENDGYFLGKQKYNLGYVMNLMSKTS